MAGRRTWLQTPVAVIAGFVCIAAASMAISVETHNPLLAASPLLLCVVPAVAYLAVTVDPAVVLTAGVVLTPFAGNWQQLGIPGAAAPDRLLIAFTIVLVVFRAATGRGEPLPRVRPVHIVLAAATLWAVVSALLAHTLFQRAPLLKIVEAYGLFPFLIFYLAPIIYTNERRRQWLLRSLVGLGAYLGLTVVFEMAGPHALVWPRYIMDPTLRHPLRPWTRAVRRCRRQRVWPVRVRAGVVRGGGHLARACQSRRRLRRPALLRRDPAHARALGVERRRGGHRRHARLLPAPAAHRRARDRDRCWWRCSSPWWRSPAFPAEVQSRASDQGPVWDRQNLTVAALNMISAKPLTGFGWSKFQADSGPYFRQSLNYPLTATSIDIHNYFLTYAVELGLIGLRAVDDRPAHGRLRRAGHAGAA